MSTPKAITVDPSVATAIEGIILSLGHVFRNAESAVAELDSLARKAEISKRKVDAASYGITASADHSLPKEKVATARKATALLNCGASLGILSKQIAALDAARLALRGDKDGKGALSLAFVAKPE